MPGPLRLLLAARKPRHAPLLLPSLVTAVSIHETYHYAVYHSNLTYNCQTERNTVSPTHTSTAPLTIQALLPDGFVPNSSHYRSAGDPAYERARRFLLVDTPGHGKLRHFATSQLANPTNVRGIIFVVDAASVAEEAGLNEAAEYLHDILLSLQKRYTDAKTSKGPKEIPVLVAANKLDLFTSLPPHLVQIQLEKAITGVRKSRAKGLKDSSNALAPSGSNLGREMSHW